MSRAELFMDNGYMCVLREGGELWKKGQGGNIAGLEDGREVMSQGMQ